MGSALKGSDSLAVVQRVCFNWEGGAGGQVAGRWEEWVDGSHRNHNVNSSSSTSCT